MQPWRAGEHPRSQQTAGAVAVDECGDEDGLADRLLAEDGLIDKLTARHGPLEQLADVADTLNRLTPGLEALEPTLEALREAVIVLDQVVNPLSNIADRIPFPGRRPRSSRSSTRSVTSQRVVDADE